MTLYDGYTTSYNESSSYGSGFGYVEEGYGAAGDYGYGYKKEAEEQYYGALSVAVLTLGLVLCVEEVRNRLDHAAVGRPFFMSVLDGIYRELATLGVVELAVHLLQTYTEGLDKNRKAVFADVHFLLFYTAIFNAFQAAILAFVCSFVSNNLWVKTEELELDHYIEIREEFDSIHQQIYGVDARSAARKSKSFADSFRNFSASRGFDSQEESYWASFSTFIVGLYYTVLYPQLKAKYRQLLVQVRFHEVRVHFLQSYDLPAKMKVSDYLVKSQFHVLEHFVHVSHSTWILLTAVCNGLYFLMGIIAEITGEGESTGFAMAIIFFSMMVIFVIISVIIYSHMESIFKKLMKRNHLWNIWDDDDEENEKKSQALQEEQQNLFLFGSPHLVIDLIKFMQFGYAIALSVVFVYYEDIEKDDTASAGAYLAATLSCYSVFLVIMSRVLPLYTACTSLGQLVDKQRLHEVKASVRLEEAERQRREQRFPGSLNRGTSGVTTKKTESSTTTLNSLYQANKGPSSEESSLFLPMAFPKLKEDSSASQQSSTLPSSNSSNPAGEVRLLADLIKMDTKSLRQFVPSSDMDGSSRSRSTRSREDRRSTSDGVQSMRYLGNFSHTALDIDGTGSDSQRTDNPKTVTVTFDDAAVTQQKTLDRRQRRERRKTQSASAAILAMRDCKEELHDNKLGYIKEDETSVEEPKVAEGAYEVTPRHNSSAGAPVVANVLDVVPEQGIVNECSFTEEDDDSMSQLSDVEQINRAAIWEKNSHQEHVEDDALSFSVKHRICNFFDSPSYIFMTNILGTMLCFFLVGMRVEAFLKQQCIIPMDDYSWDLTLDNSFRLLVAWLSSFIAVSLAVVFLSPNLKKKHLLFAGFFDIILCAVCLVLLLVAEKQRCCDDVFILEEGLEEEMYGFRMLQESEACYDSTLECKCAAFGHRTSGGLGSMEPFVALIALRIFRFYLAKRLSNALQCWDSNKHDHDSHEHVHGHGHGEEKGSAVELWQHAIAQAPDIVEKYGEFSSELLQVMLGIEVLEIASAPAANALNDKGADESSAETALGFSVEGNPVKDHVFLEEKRYKKLDPEVQGIIAAGKFGMPMKPCSVQPNAESGGYQAPSRAVAPMVPLEFEVDKKTAQVENGRIDSTLSFPNATLVRSMRRCERKLLPLLNKWTTVDVVVTCHEMVYVDVHDGDDTDLQSEELNKREASKEAVRATHGGKGLRLCDVTAGRRIVGHLSFKDVQSIHVEREPVSPIDNEGDVDVTEREHNEFWQSHTDTEASAEPKQRRWDKVNQDRLKLQTTHGTMYLRFHSDLVDSELHPERVLEEVGDESPLHKDIAFQWAQTIVWNCGVNQLQQHLPHFGQDDGDELRDYLQIVPKEKKHGHRRLASFTPHWPVHHHHRSQSYDGELGDYLQSVPKEKKHGHRRLASFTPHWPHHHQQRSQSPLRRGRMPPESDSRSWRRESAPKKKERRSVEC